MTASGDAVQTPGQYLVSVASPVDGYGQNAPSPEGTGSGSGSAPKIHHCSYWPPTYMCSSQGGYVLTGQSYSHTLTEYIQPSNALSQPAGCDNQEEYPFANISVWTGLGGLTRENRKNSPYALVQAGTFVWKSGHSSVAFWEVLSARKFLNQHERFRNVAIKVWPGDSIVSEVWYRGASATKTRYGKYYFFVADLHGGKWTEGDATYTANKDERFNGDTAEYIVESHGFPLQKFSDVDFTRGLYGLDGQTAPDDPVQSMPPADRHPMDIMHYDPSPGEDTPVILTDTTWYGMVQPRTSSRTIG